MNTTNNFTQELAEALSNLEAGPNPPTKVPEGFKFVRYPGENVWFLVKAEAGYSDEDYLEYLKGSI